MVITRRGERSICKLHIRAVSNNRGDTKHVIVSKILGLHSHILKANPAVNKQNSIF